MVLTIVSFLFYEVISTCCTRYNYFFFYLKENVICHVSDFNIVTTKIGCVSFELKNGTDSKIMSCLPLYRVDVSQSFTKPCYGPLLIEGIKLHGGQFFPSFFQEW